jgi:type II secretory pathway predicted ATPase ExeA
MAYQNLFQTFGLRENPFRVAPDPRYLYLGRTYESTLSELMQGVQSHSGLLVLTGDPGTGKTMLLRHFLQSLHQKKYSNSYIFHSSLNTAGLFEFIARDFGLRVESSRKSDLVATLEKWLLVRQAEGDSPVVVIDEAQALSVRTLSGLCLLLNLENEGGKLIQLLLAGQPELDEKLRQPELRQLRQRVTVRCRLPLLSLEETAEYVAARLRSAGGVNTHIFPAESLEALYSYVQGVPRITNLLCEKAMVAAYAEKSPAVSPAHIRRAASEFDFAYEPVSAPAQEIRLQYSSVLPLDPREIPSETQTETAPPPEPRQVVESLTALPAVPTEGRAKPSVTVLTPKLPMQEPAPQPAPHDERSVAARTMPQPDRLTSFSRYWRDVAQSFVRDWKHFLSSFQTRAAPDGKVLFMKKYDFRRDLVAPVSRWLNKPVTLRGRDRTASDGRAGRGSF